ncbi:MAG: hypothetical protein HY924_10455 [Elusimicrobia bacterium]|nr:hypothetical protein [Elusimicrobiota bacterium]
MTAPGQEVAFFLREPLSAEAPLPRSGRIYLGDETCERRLPAMATLESLVSRRNEIAGLTLMTPLLTDEGMARVAETVARLSAAFGRGFEVVANDWGVLELLERMGGRGAELVCGRLLAGRYMFFDSFPEEFLDLLAARGVRRVELNSAAQLRATRGRLRERGMKTHLHWPAMFLTATRFCPCDGAFAGPDREAIASCSRSCDRRFAVMTHPSGRRLILRGNAYLALHEGLSGPPEEADRIVHDDLPAGLDPSA